ncbi:MAG: hypothetical protein HQL78_03920 [Magnetococcales bacterium]|nr:hypothetical protein [Magnetococcales bacterium]
MYTLNYLIIPSHVATSNHIQADHKPFFPTTHSFSEILALLYRYFLFQWDKVPIGCRVALGNGGVTALKERVNRQLCRSSLEKR